MLRDSTSTFLTLTAHIGLVFALGQVTEKLNVFFSHSIFFIATTKQVKLPWLLLVVANSPLGPMF